MYTCIYSGRDEAILTPTSELGWSCPVPANMPSNEMIVMNSRSFCIASCRTKNKQLTSTILWYSVIFISVVLTLILLIYLNFHPLKVVSRYRDPQLQVAKNYSYLLNLSINIWQFWCLDTHFIPNNCDFWSTNKTDYDRQYSWSAG